jgi:cytoskeletal protein CcmA (bactofilin family)
MTQERFALVPRAGSFEGQIAVVGETRIDGTVLGSLQGPGHLVLGSHARVEGRIECETVSSRGAIIGPVVARKLAHLGDGARVEGDLVAPAIEVDGDVIWNGKARVGP